MHISTALLLLLPLSLSAPTSSDSSISHSQNVSKIKRSVQVKVRRSVGSSKRACKAPTAIVEQALNVGTPSASGSSEQVSSNSTKESTSYGGDAIFPLGVKNSWTTVQGRSGSMSCESSLIISLIDLLSAFGSVLHL